MTAGEGAHREVAYKNHKDLNADELNDIIFSVLRREYPKKVKRIANYVERNSDELRVVVDGSRSFSGMVIQRLKILEEEKKVEWTPSGWKLK
jgi:activator of HSP90 ATPase